MFNLFKDQKTLWPKILVKIIDCILIGTGRLGIQLTAEELFDSEIFRLKDFSVKEVEKFIENFKRLTGYEDFYIFKISMSFSLIFTENKWEKRILLELVKFWECTLTDNEIEKYLKKVNSFIYVEEFIQKRDNLRKKLKK